MTERERIESAIRAGCMAFFPEDNPNCVYPNCSCARGSIVNIRDTALAAIRAYLVASREPSKAAVEATYGRYIGFEANSTRRNAMVRANDARLSEFDATVAEMQKDRR